MLKIMDLKEKNGITLMALVVIIIILLILTGISIQTLSGDNGIIKNAVKAKEESEIKGEKEVLERAIMQAMEKDKHGDLTKSELEQKLKSSVGDENIEVIGDENTLFVKFKESNRFYEITSNGNILEPIQINSDKYAGDLTKGGKYDGTKDSPFQIACIEDLVVFSIMTNGGNGSLNIEANDFANEYVELVNDIDFNYIFSYDDYTSTIYGDLNQDGKVEDIKTELTKTEEGCIGFSGIKDFKGIFDGKNKMIYNIYQNMATIGSNGGLFIYNYCIDLSNIEINNLSLSGRIISGKMAAGIASTNNGYGIKIVNCKNYAYVEGIDMVGGITDWAREEIIENCQNYGDLKWEVANVSYGGVGGISGYANNMTFNNCKNYGNINGSKNAGGIVGVIDNCNIENCFNKGNSLAGIVYWVRSGVDANIMNCCNFGECNDGIVSILVGANSSSNMKLSILNCYNVGKVSNCGIIGEQDTICLTLELNIENCYNAGESKYAIIGKVKDVNVSGLEVTVTRNMKNTYYDVSKSIGVGVMTDGVISKTEAEMKENTFVSLLNVNGEYFALDNYNINKGYPILNWQIE